MSTAARKLRKRQHREALTSLAISKPRTVAHKAAKLRVAETAFVHPAKVGTPFYSRAWWNLTRILGDGRIVARSSAKRRKVAAAYGVDYDASLKAAREARLAR